MVIVCKNHFRLSLSLGFIPNKCGYRYVFDLIYLATSGKEILPLKYVGYAEIAKNTKNRRYR